MNQQSKKNLTNRIVALAGITVFAFFIGIYVCVFSNYLEQHNTRKKLFGATYMTMNNEFYKIVNNQIRMQVEKNGDQMITLDPALDQKKQNEQIKQLVKRKVDFSKSSRLESSRTRTCSCKESEDSRDCYRLTGLQK